MEPDAPQGLAAHEGCIPSQLPYTQTLTLNLLYYKIRYSHLRAAGICAQYTFSHLTYLRMYVCMSCTIKLCSIK